MEFDPMDRAAAWWTAELMTNDYIQTAASYVGDLVDTQTVALVANKVFDFACSAMGYEIHDPIIENAREQIVENAVEVTAIAIGQGDLEPQEPPEISTEIGGPGVDAAINEIRDVQDRQAIEVKDLEARHEGERNALAARDDKVQGDYFAARPDQSPAERESDQQKFEGAKSLNQQDLAAKQEIETNNLRQEHAAELQTIATRSDPTPPPPPPPPPAPPQPSRDF